MTSNCQVARYKIVTNKPTIPAIPRIFSNWFKNLIFPLMPVTSELIGLKLICIMILLSINQEPFLKIRGVVGVLWECCGGVAANTPNLLSPGNFRMETNSKK
jgi:hypothetical protein